MRIVYRILLGVLILVIAAAAFMRFRVARERANEEAYHRALPKTITLNSTNFSDGSDIPVDCSCHGNERSPELYWENLPPATKALVLLVTDYDAPAPAFPLFNITHWVLYNIPTTVPYIPGAVTPEQVDRVKAAQGLNSTGSQQYIGPCPPYGRHAYVFRIYALDKSLTFDRIPDKRTVLDAMNGHILGYGELTGYFQKP